MDVEFDNRKSFRKKICLIQLGTSDEEYIIDPLVVNPTTLQSIFESETTKKIFFAGVQDIQLLQSRYNWKINNIFDISIVYNFHRGDLQTLSLNQVVEELIGQTIPKNSGVQMSNWQDRPLETKQLEYAALDVRYLIQTYKTLQKRLTDLESDIINLYCHHQTAITPLIEPNPFYIFELTGSSKVKSYWQKVVGFELHQWRIELAKQKDINPGYVLSKRDLEKLLYRPPTTEDEFKRMHSKVYRKHKSHLQTILEIINTTIEEYGEDGKRHSKFDKLQKQYNQYQPYHDEIADLERWPYDISISAYKDRRDKLLHLYFYLKDNLNIDMRASYLLPKKFSHRIALSPKIDIDQLISDIKDSNNLEELFKILKSVNDQINRENTFI